MPNFKISMLLKSSIRSKFQSDTIFGHVCWAFRYLYGEDKLEKWLKDYAESPTLISNASPKGFAPKPVLAPLSYQTRCELSAGNEENSELGKMGSDKKHKKIHFVREEWLWECQSYLTSKTLYLHLNELIKEKEAFKVESTLVTHNRFNRNTGRADEGGLYDTEEDFYILNEKENLEFWFYLKSETLSLKKVEEIMNYISLTGFGADKSVGKGNIEITKIEEVDIEVPDKVNAFISFSNFIPAGSAEINGYYKTITKFGKLGGDFSTGGNPFKKPIIMLEAGALIMADDFSEYKFYGRLQPDIHSSPELNIVHYGYAFPFPVYYEEVKK